MPKNQPKPAIKLWPPVISGIIKTWNRYYEVIKIWRKQRLQP